MARELLQLGQVYGMSRDVLERDNYRDSFCSSGTAAYKVEHYRFDHSIDSFDVVGQWRRFLNNTSAVRRLGSRPLVFLTGRQFDLTHVLFERHS